AGRALLPESLIENLFAGPFALKGEAALVEYLYGTKRVSFLYEPTELSVIKRGENVLCEGEIRLVPAAKADAYLILLGNKLFFGICSENQSAVRIEAEDALDLTRRYYK